MGIRLAQSTGPDKPRRGIEQSSRDQSESAAGDRAEEVLAIGNPGEERVLRFHNGIFLLGRGDECELRIRHKFTSRQHARIVRTGGRFFFLEDCSRNGTYLHQDGMEEVFLKPGQRVPLIGHGIIGLGVPAVAESPGTIRYRVMQVAQT